MRHRGPDATGQWTSVDQAVGFGHNRLSIVDLDSRSNQPLFAGHVVLVFNGEVLNWKRLRDELQSLGYSFSTTSDTEVIAKGYLAWGTGVFDRLHGMFALALWDPVQQKVLLARDQCGIKPLYLRYTSRGVFFSSECAPLTGIEEVSPCASVLDDLFSFGFPWSNQTLYNEVTSLEPGTVLSIDVSRPQLTSRAIDVARYNAEGGVSALQGLLRQSVSDHLVADVPVALALSGGVDSSAIAACAAREQQIHAFTFSFCDGDDPEVSHAIRVAQHLRMPHETGRIQVRDLDVFLRLVSSYAESPIINPNLFASFGLAAGLAERGYRCMLIGEGSDELFAGYPWHQFAMKDLSPAELYLSYRERRAQKVLGTILRSPVDGPTHSHDERRSAAFIQDIQSASTPLQGFLANERRCQMQHAQLQRVDRMTMAHSTEARVPYLYPPVIEFAKSLSDASLVKSAGQEPRDKAILRQALRDWLPVEVANRPKFGKGGTLDLWSTPLFSDLSRVFARACKSQEFAHARQWLEPCIDWAKVNDGTFQAKEQLTLALTIYCAASQLDPTQSPRASQWRDAFGLSWHD
jgi:asparagine synthase (glutamine-hydrolysing)